MGIIRELPASLVNQIAAGEVVERPASVLKELVENSLDAGSTKIFVMVDLSNDFLQVTDNGSGLLREDLPKAFIRHATSKIASFEDLVSARTLGFRGEALASISSVSKVTVETRHASEDVGTRLLLEPETDPVMSDWHGPIGTRMIVRDLFHNVPVRRKFLKSVQTEMGHLIEALNRLAMGFHECQFDLSTPSRKILSLESRQSPFLRLLDQYSSISEEDLIAHEIPGERQSLQVFLLRPDKVRKDRQYQNIFINRRWVRHPGLLEAITQGVSGKISRDVHIGAWVYLDLEPEKMDVNVHPTKREVRLLEGDRLFSFVRRAVEECLSLFDSEFRLAEAESSSHAREEEREEKKESLEIDLGFSAGFFKKIEPSRFSQLTDVGKSSGLGPFGKMPGFSNASHTHSDPFKNLPESLKDLPTTKGYQESEKISMLGQIGKTFLILLMGENLAIVDWHTAHERINYEKFRHQVEENGVRSIALLFPLTYRVSLSVADNLDNRLEELSKIGFELDRTGPDAFRIRSVPFLLEHEDPVKVLDGIREQSLNFDLPILRSDRIDEVLMTISCHSSVRKNDEIDLIDGERLVRELLGTAHPYTCPHGRPTMIRVAWAQLNQWFGR